MRKFKFPHVVTFLTALALILGAGTMALARPPGPPPHHRVWPKGSIIGRVVNFRGKPVRGAIVRVMCLPGKMHGMHRRMGKPMPGRTIWRHFTVGITRTGKKGFFAIQNAPIGRYRVMAFKRGVGGGHIPHPVIVRPHKATHVGTIKLRHGRKHPWHKK